MGKFILGVIVTLVLAAIGGLLVMKMGWVDIRADQQPTRLERRLASTALDAYLERHTDGLNNPVQPTDDNLSEGMAIYQMNCAECHGKPEEPVSKFGTSMNPRAPQFMKRAPDQTDAENYFETKHGIRWTAMPSWDKMLTDDQLWKVTTFLSHMEKLPPALDQEWKKNAPAAPATAAPAAEAPAKSK
jgi:mono/diheme cytochrome c family protein